MTSYSQTEPERKEFGADIKPLCPVGNLMQAEEEFKLAFENASDAILWTDPVTGLIINCNKAAEVLLEKKREEIIGRPKIDIHPPEIADICSKRLEERVKNENILSVQTKIQAQSGAIKDIHATSSVLHIGDKLIVQCIFRDVTEQKKTETELEYRRVLEKLVAEISTRFVNLSSEEMDVGISDALKAMGMFMKVDRAYVFQFSQDGMTMDNTHEWTAENVESKISELKNIDTSIFGWSLTEVKNKKVVNISRVDDLPPEAAAEKEEFRSEDIQSVILVPLICGKTVLGFIGFDSVWEERYWDDEVVALLRLVGEIFAAAFGRRKVDKELQYRIELEKLVTTISRRFVGPLGNRLDGLMNEALHDLGEFLDLDFCFICRYCNAEQQIKKMYTWRGENIEPLDNEHLEKKAGDVLQRMTRMKRCDVVNIADAGDLPADVPDRRSMQLTRIQSLLCISFEIVPDETGFIGFATEQRPRQWPEATVSLLNIVAEIFGSVFQQKKVLSELARERELFNALMSRIPDNIYFKDRKSRFVRVSKALAGTLGIDDPSKLIGKTDKDFYSKELATKSYRDEQEIIETAKTIVDKEEKETWPDGFETWVLTTKVPWYDDKGEIVGTFGISKDVTEHKNATLALEKAHGFISALMDHIPDYIFFKDKEGRFIKINKALAQKYGLHDAEEAVGMTDFDFYPKAIAKRFFAAEQQIIKSGEPIIGVEERGKLPDGSEAWISTTKMPLYNEEGEIIGTFGISRDITARKRTEQERLKIEGQMQHTQKLESLGVLSSGIAHDFNNLLMGILGNTGLAQAELPPGSPARLYVQEIEDITLRATELTNQMLAYAGKSKMVTKQFNLTDLVREMGSFLKTAISSKVKVHYKLTDDIPLAEGDPTQIRQVAMNLITNASDAIGDKRGSITVITGVTECDRDYFLGCYVAEDLEPMKYVFVEVQDTGCGMSSETQEKIFDPFYTTKVKGRGLGLAAVIGIVRGHQGAFRVYSELNKGSVFRVLLPCVKTQIEVSAAEPREWKQWTGEGTILIVDDDEVVRTVTERMLRKLGFSILKADEGQAAIHEYRKYAQKIVAIMLDIALPGMDGEKVLQKLKRIKRDVPVIMMSGYSEESAVGDLPSGSYEGFLQKPYTADMLTEKLQKILKRK
ncbi:PAS domain S-box protein [Verrucomicrobiota bacterium]